MTDKLRMYAVLIASFVLASCGGRASSAPQIHSQVPAATLAVSTASIVRPQSATLTWSTDGATAVTITGIGTVAANGSAAVAPSTTTTYTLTATGPGGSTQASASITVLAVLFSDSFDRPDQLGLGVTPQGLPWMVAGAGQDMVAISNHHYVDGPAGGVNVSYAGVLLPQAPVRLSGMVSFLPSGTGGSGASVAALISSSDTNIQLAHMLHLIIGRNGLSLTWWDGTNQNNQPAQCTGDWKFTPPLPMDGTSYPIAMNISGDTVSVEKPDGTTFSCVDPHFSQVAGSLGIWELAYDQTQVDMPRWDKAEALANAQ